VNGVFCRHVDQGNGGKVGANGWAAEDNRKQWQRQTGNNQLKVMVASGGIDSSGGGGVQRQSTAICSKTPMAKVIVVAPPTPLSLLLAIGSRWVAGAAARE
jgi:hypothetical protein